MKRIVLMSAVFSVFCLLFSPALHADVNAEDGESLNRFPPGIKALVDKTYSVSARERAEAVYHLGEAGEAAELAVPFIMRILDDQSPVWCRYNGYGMWTTPGKEAAKALVKLGPQASALVSEMIEGRHGYVFLNPFNEKNFVFALSIQADTEFASLQEGVDWWEEEIAH